MKPLALNDATKLLPLLKSIVSDIVVYFQDFSRIQKTGKIAENRDYLNEIISKINGCIKEAEALGCLVEECHRGIINIPTLYRGRPVFLCITPVSENTIDYYHEIDETYEERSKITNRHAFLVRG